RSISLMGFRKYYMAFAVGRLSGNTLELAGAGMPPALIYRAETKTVEQVSLKGMPLGSRTDYPYSKSNVTIQPGDVMLFMTDGLPELFNNNGDMIGYSRVRQIFSSLAADDPDQIINELYRASEHWLNGSAQNDDMTFFVLKRREIVIPKNKVSTRETSPEYSH
ncbi:MAG: PP2C family protein-serine/threonine phosphatase, partial [Balneolaceae bacterium]|nr:PP2C family protein-serine/threonine phosphatase [Balneolaceae bacterium]